MIIWPILWILAMIGLVVATVVVAMKEKKTRAKAAQQYAPGMSMEQPQAAMAEADMGSAFGDPLESSPDSFGNPDAEFAALDEDAFK